MSKHLLVLKCLHSDITLQFRMQQLNILCHKNAQTEAFAVLSYGCQHDPRQISASVQQLLMLVA